MRVFVTGGTGFVGSHLVAALSKQGDEVILLAREPSRATWLVGLPGVSVVHGDVERPQSYRQALGGCDACVHLAIVWDAEPTELELKDSRATVALFEAAAGAGVGHMVLTSSTAVHRPFRLGMTEEDRLMPADLYGATKAANEAFLFAFTHGTPMRGNVVRPGPALGGPAFEGGPMKADRRIHEIVRAALAGETIRVEGGGRQFVPVRDLVRLYAALLRSDANRETYLAVTPDLITWQEIAREAIEIVGKGQMGDYLADATPEPHRFDVGKIERVFGLVFDAREALRETLMALVATLSQT